MIFGLVFDCELQQVDSEGQKVVCGRALIEGLVEEHQNNRMETPARDHSLRTRVGTGHCARQTEGGPETPRVAHVS